MVARNTTELSKVAQQRIRDWAASGWSGNDRYIGWRVYKLRSQMDLVQFEDIHDFGQHEYVLRDLMDIRAGEAGVGHFRNSRSMSLDEILEAIDLANTMQLGRYHYNSGVRLNHVDDKIEETRRLATAEYGSW